MKAVFAILLGYGVIILVHPRPLPMIALGLAAGCAVVLAETAFPRPERTYLLPTSRPRQITLGGQIAAVSVFALLGLLLAACALMVRMPLASGPPVIAYFGGMMLGLAVGQLLTLSKRRARHNARLDRMTLQTPLDFES